MRRKMIAGLIFAVVAAATVSSPAPAGAPDIEMVLVKGGCFQMGDTFGDGKPDEKPVHEVCINDFSIGKYPVTQEQWMAVMGNNPAHFTGDRRPVESVSWNDAQEFIKQLNALAGRTYRLPTEAEWEYAARSGGKKEKYAGTSNDAELGNYAWHKANSGDKTHVVGLKKPNGLGLYDMAGNIWEWCQDKYGDVYYEESPRNNPQGPKSGSDRVLRGGSWYNGPAGVRAANRGYSAPDVKDYGLMGFRLVRTP